MNFQSSLDLVERKMTMSHTPYYEEIMIKDIIKLPLQSLQGDLPLGGFRNEITHP